MIISLFSDKINLHTNQSSFSFKLAIWVRKGELSNEPDIRCEIDGRPTEFNVKNIGRFDPPRLKNKSNLDQFIWHFRKLSIDGYLNPGKHTLTVRLMDLTGNQLSRLDLHGIAEPYAPEIKELNPVFEPKQASLSFQVASRQLPEIMQLPLSVLSEIGKTIAAKFRARGIERIYDLLGLDDGNYFIPDVNPQEVLDAVTKAQILNGFSLNSNKWPHAYSLNQLALLLVEDLALKAELNLAKAKKMLFNIRKIHMVLDRSLQDDLTLGAFVSHRHSGIASWHASLNQVDVSELVMVDKNVFSFSTQGLNEGHYLLELTFIFYSGNRRKLQRTFTIDHSGPSIELTSPGSWYVNDQDLIVNVTLHDQWGDVDPKSVQLWMNEKQVEQQLNFTSSGFGCRIPAIVEGTHQLQVQAADTFGNVTTSPIWEITVDRTPPAIQIKHPLSPHFTSEEQVVISGKAIDAHIEKIQLGDQIVTLDPDGKFELVLPLEEHVSSFSIEALDKAGNSTFSNTVQVIRLTEDQSVVHGSVVDSNEQPLSGVEILEQRSQTITWTDDKGHFLLSHLPEGTLNLLVKPPEESSMSSCIVPVTTSYGQYSYLGKVFLIQKGAPAKISSTTSGKLLQSEEHENLELLIPSNSFVIYPNGEEKPISLSLVDSTKLPVNLPAGVPKCRAAVFGPSGLRIETGPPMSVTMPNDLSLPKGEKLLLLAIDGETGGLSSAGVAEVSQDEQCIVSQPGHGLTHFSIVVPMPTGAMIEPYREDREVALDDAVKGGSKMGINLPGFKLLNRVFQPRLVYSSLAAAPTVHMTAIFRGLKEINAGSRMIHHTHVKKEASIKRVEYFADYSLWLREFRDYKGTEYFNWEYSDLQFRHVTYLPTDVTAPVLPLPDSLWYGGTFGPKFQWILDHQRQQEWTFRLYEIDMSLSVQERVAIWPESITGRYLFSDLDSGAFTLQGPVTPIGPEPKPGETDNRESFPRLPADTLLSYHIDPRLPDGSFYPTGLYSWLGHFDIQGRTYSHIQSSQIAKKGAFNYDGIKWMLEHSEGEKKAELEQLLVVLQKAYDLNRKGAIYQSRYSYGDPVDYLTNEQAGQTVIHNLANSNLGAGWKLEEQHELVPVGSNQVLMISPEGKQVFTVENKIQQVGLAYLEKIIYSHDGSKLYGISRMGNDWIAGTGEIFTPYFGRIFSSKVFALLYPTKESFIKILYETLMNEPLFEEELAYWMESDVFRADQTATGTWSDYSVMLFIYSDKCLRYLINDQYQTALDREPTEEELARHKSEVSNTLYHTFRFNRDTQLHYEKLTVIITDLFFSLRHEMNVYDGLDWYIYIWKKIKGSEPDLYEELDPMVRFIGTYRTGLTDEQVRSGLNMWLAGHYWIPKIQPVHEQVLGFPPYSDYGIRIYENGEERDFGIPFKSMGQIGRYITTVRYRCYRHPSSTNPKSLYMSPNVVETSPREVYYNGSIYPNIKGMVERKDGTLFLSDANANHIYLITDKVEKIPPYMTTDLHYGGSHIMATVVGMGKTELPLPPSKYYDDQDNLINLPEEEAKWQAAYMEYSRTTVGFGVNAMVGYTPDGKFIDESNQRIREVAVDTPCGLALDHKDRLIFAEAGNHRVRRMDLEVGEIVTIAGNGEATGYDPTAIDPLKTAIPEPIDIVLSKKQELFILFHIGQGQQCIGKIDRAGFFKHVAGAPQPGAGTLDTGGDARFFKLTGASSLALSPSGELFVGLANQHRVMVVTPDGFIDTAAGNGESGQPNDGGPALQASLGKPYSIACDKNGNLLINDQVNKSLRMVNLALCENETATYFRAPLGYFDASLVRQRNGSWRKAYKNGSSVHFNKYGKHTHTIDRNGNETKYLYEGDRLSKVMYPAGGMLELAYNEQGKVKQITDHIGRTTSIQVEDGRLTSLENAEGTTWEFAYDRDGRVLKVSQGETSEIEYSYNAFGRLISQKTNGRLTQIERPDDIAAGNLDQENQEALIAFQNQTSIIASEGEKTTFKLEHGRLTELISGPDGNIHVKYNLERLPVSITRPSGTQLLYAYNDQGDQIRVEDTFTDSIVESIYDGSGRKLEETNNQGIKTTFEYDDWGNLIKCNIHHDQAKQVLSHQSFDERGLLIKRWKKGVVTTYQYDAQGNLILEQRGNIQTQFERDSAGNVVMETKGSMTRRFGYDSFNQLVLATEGENQTRFQYDERGNLTQITAPNQAVQQMTYDGRNRMVSFENPNGKRWTFGFDWEDRMIRKVYPDGKELIRIWNSSTEMFETFEGKESVFTYFEKDNIRSGSNANGTFACELDEAGRKVRQLQIMDDTLYQLIYEVDSMNRVLMLQSIGENVQYEYGSFGRLEAIQCAAWQIKFVYDDSGRLITLHGDNGLLTQLSYNQSGLVQAYKSSKPGADEEAINLSYNEAGYPMSIHSPFGQRQLSYDTKGQLSRVQGEGISRHYEYDSIGNRIAGPKGTYTYDETRLLLLSCPQYDYLWDELGRLKEKTDQTTAIRHAYGYNAQGQLVTYQRFDEQTQPVIDAQYAYDAIGRRIRKEVSYRDEPTRNCHKKWIYNGINPFLELNEAGEVVRQYLCGVAPDSWLGFIESGKAYYYQKDHLGSIIGIMDEEGITVATYQYDEYGIMMASEPDFDNDITYTGREYDVESGLYYYRKRHYDPMLGRFIQPDEYLGSAKEPKSMVNRYVYVHNNPFIYKDPSGLNAEEVLGGIGDAALWIVEAIWEIIKFFLTPNGEAIAPVEEGPSGTYRDSFDITRANNALAEGYFDAKEWLAELIDQSIGKVLRELWDVVSGLFDWSMPDIELPGLSEVNVSNLDGYSTTALDFGMPGTSDQRSGSERAIFMPIPPPKIRIFPVRACFGASITVDEVSFATFQLNQSEKPNYRIPSFPVFLNKYAVLIIQSSIEVDSIEVSLNGANLLVLQNPKSGNTFYIYNNIKNPLYAPNGEKYWYVDVGFNIVGNWECQYQVGNSRGNIKWHIGYKK